MNKNYILSGEKMNECIGCNFYSNAGCLRPYGVSCKNNSLWTPKGYVRGLRADLSVLEDYSGLSQEIIDEVCKPFIKNKEKIMNWKDKTIQNIKDCGQSLIDNAEKIVNNYNFTRGVTITCYVDEINEAPYISVNSDFYPEKFIERYS